MGKLSVPWSLDPRKQKYTSEPYGIFKHKYLTQPTIPATDALLREVDDICNTLANIAPATDKKWRAIDFLMDIFKGQPKRDESGTDTQRVCMEASQAQRVVLDKA